MGKVLEGNSHNHYKNNDDVRSLFNGEDYVLSGFSIDNTNYVCLINSKSGSRWNEPVKVESYSDISKKEADLIFEGFENNTEVSR